MVLQQRQADGVGTLADVIDRILDKGLVINADIRVQVVGVELLDIRIRAALASFETAAMYGLEFPSGVRMDTPGWTQLEATERCPQCDRRSVRQELLSAGCPWCGWESAAAGANGRVTAPLVTRAESRYGPAG